MGLFKLTTTIFTFIGLFIGVILGIYLKYFTHQPWSDRKIMKLQFIGELFLRSVNCLILPLIISSIISASCHVTKSGGIGLKAFYYYTTTTILGITLCVFLAQTIRPGEFYQNKNNKLLTKNYSKKFITVDIFLDLLRNLVPDNIINACINQYQTILIKPENATEAKDIYRWSISHKNRSGTNVLGLVSFSLLLGISIGKIGKKGKPLQQFFQSISDVIMKIMKWLVMIFPCSMLFLMPAKLLETEDLGIMLSRLGIYVSIVLFGLFLHGFLILPGLYFICTHKSPIKIFKNIGPAVCCAIATSSSSATVPISIKCLDNIGINKKVSSFIIPLGSNLGLDGISLYETLGALFIIQLRGFDYSLMEIIGFSIMCTVSCIGAAGLPNGGYVMLILVLESIGIPPEDVTLIIAIDCFVDRLRTTINVIADVFGASLISHFYKANNVELNELQELQNLY